MPAFCIGFNRRKNKNIFGKMGRIAVFRRTRRDLSELPKQVTR